MNDSSAYTPPKVWKWEAQDGGAFTNINRPIAGPTHDKELPIGEHPLQLYSLGTPNGVKVTVLLEELLAQGHKDAEYDAWLIKIGDGDQFGSGFVDVNPNSKIPAMVDRSGAEPVRIFESGSILFYLGEKFGLREGTGVTLGFVGVVCIVMQGDLQILLSLIPSPDALYNSSCRSYFEIVSSCDELADHCVQNWCSFVGSPVSTSSDMHSCDTLNYGGRFYAKGK